MAHTSENGCLDPVLLPVWKFLVNSLIDFRLIGSDSVVLWGPSSDRYLLSLYEYVPILGGLVVVYTCVIHMTA